jgi:hypothetical protein
MKKQQECKSGKEELKWPSDHRVRLFLYALKDIRETAEKYENAIKQAYKGEK